MEIKVKEICSANALEVKVGTTGVMGGNHSHGGETYFALNDLGGTDMDILCTENEYGHKGFELILRGDCELRTFVQALEFAVLELKNKTMI